MRDIGGLEGQYAATRDGRIWSYKRERFLTPQKIKSGYLRVRIRDRNKIYKPTMPLVHRLVAATYIPNPLSKKEVHHRNATRADNRVSNLQWVSREENNQAAWDCGNKKFIRSTKHSAAVSAANKARIK